MGLTIESDRPDLDVGIGYIAKINEPFCNPLLQQLYPDYIIVPPGFLAVVSNSLTSDYFHPNLYIPFDVIDNVNKQLDPRQISCVKSTIVDGYIARKTKGKQFDSKYGLGPNGKPIFEIRLLSEKLRILGEVLLRDQHQGLVAVFGVYTKAEQVHFLRGQRGLK